MVKQKWGMYGIRIRNNQEMTEIKNDIKQYMKTKNKDSLKKYNDKWDSIRKIKGFDENTIYELIDNMTPCSELYINAAAADIWDVLHPLSPEEEKQRNRDARKAIINLGIKP